MTSTRAKVGILSGFLIAYGVYMFPFGYEEFRWFVKYSLFGGDELLTIWFMYGSASLALVVGIALAIWAYKKKPKQLKSMEKSYKKAKRKF